MSTTTRVRTMARLDRPRETEDAATGNAPGTMTNRRWWPLHADRVERTRRPFNGVADTIAALDALTGKEAARYRLTAVGQTWAGWSRAAELIAHGPHRDRIRFVNRCLRDEEIHRFFPAVDVRTFRTIRARFLSHAPGRSPCVAALAPRRRSARVAAVLAGAATDGSIRHADLAASGF